LYGFSRLSAIPTNAAPVLGQAGGHPATTAYPGASGPPPARDSLDTVPDPTVLSGLVEELESEWGRGRRGA
ncbi:hypothetical protein, partial [Streptomyces sp. NPDC058954]|uniref:hypothetical protein n=1 Tax=Streptomyces sp. NPDC058954 TaxID=3346677 RepID=UPI00367BFCA6